MRGGGNSKPLDAFETMKTSALPILLLFALSAWSGCSRETNSMPPAVREGTKPGAVVESRFTTIRVDPRTERIELFLRDDAGRPFNRFDRLASWLASRNKR